MTSKDLNAIDQLISARIKESLAEFRDELTQKFDKLFRLLDPIAGEIKKSEEERIVSSNQISNHSDRLDNFEKRISSLEKRVLTH